MESVVLHGREREIGALRSCLDTARSGEGTVLVLRGDAGIGKTALLDNLADADADVHVLRIEGVESEANLGYAALHRLLLPIVASMTDLPENQRAALGSAFGVDSANNPDRFLINLAALTLLTDAAVAAPVLCLVDDAQWIDRESLDALTFVARRLQADRVAIVFAMRDPNDRAASFAGLPMLDITGISLGDSRQVIADLIHVGVDVLVAERIVAEAGGNPLALVEFARGCSTAPGQRGLTPEPLPIRHRIEAQFASRTRDLPEDTKTVLLLAASESSGEVDLIARVADRLGLTLTALDAAENAGLVTIGNTIVFRHSLVRSAVYSTAPSEDRRRAHHALASVADPTRDVERRAWHLAASAERQDEAVAREVDLASRLVGARGSSTSQVELLVRAADLTPDPDKAVKRRFIAGTIAAVAGDQRRAADVIDDVLPSLVDPSTRATARWVSGMLLTGRRQYASMPRRLLDAAIELDQFDHERARHAMLDVVFALGLARHRSEGVATEDVVEVVRALQRGSVARALRMTSCSRDT